MKKQLFIVIAVLLLGIIACEGGTGGSVTGSQSSCEFVGNSGTCDGGFKKLSGTYDTKLSAGYYQEGDPVFIEGTVAVETGRVKITFTANDGTVTTANAAPGSPATLSGRAAVESFIDDLFIPITFEAIDKEASGISYSVTIREP